MADLRIGDAAVAGETQMILRSADEYQRIVIHPWDRPSWAGTRDRSVAVTLGLLDKNGHVKTITKKRKKNGWTEENAATIDIFDRDQFIEGILAVFPELQRNPVSV